MIHEEFKPLLLYRRQSCCPPATELSCWGLVDPSHRAERMRDGFEPTEDSSNNDRTSTNGDSEKN